MSNNARGNRSNNYPARTRDHRNQHIADVSAPFNPEPPSIGAANLRTDEEASQDRALSPTDEAVSRLPSTDHHLESATQIPLQRHLMHFPPFSTSVEDTISRARQAVTQGPARAPPSQEAHRLMTSFREQALADERARGYVAQLPYLQTGVAASPLPLPSSVAMPRYNNAPQPPPMAYFSPADIEALPPIIALAPPRPIHNPQPIPPVYPLVPPQPICTPQPMPPMYPLVPPQPPNRCLQCTRSYHHSQYTITNRTPRYTRPLHHSPSTIPNKTPPIYPSPPSQAIDDPEPTPAPENPTHYLATGYLNPQQDALLRFDQEVHDGARGLFLQQLAEMAHPNPRGTRERDLIWSACRDYEEERRRIMLEEAWKRGCRERMR